MIVKRLGAIFVDQLHTAFGEALFGDEAIVGVGDNIHNRVTNCEHVKANFSHIISCLRSGAP